MRVEPSGIARDAWDGVQLFDDDTLIMPDPLDDGLARFVCAQTWSEVRPWDHDKVFAALAVVTTHYVHEDVLLEAHPEFREVFGDTLNVREMRLAADILTNPLVSSGHECGHIGLLATTGDDTHSDPEVWGKDGGHDGPGIVGVVKERIVGLRLGH